MNSDSGDDDSDATTCVVFGLVYPQTLDRSCGFQMRANDKGFKVDGRAGAFESFKSTMLKPCFCLTPSSIQSPEPRPDATKCYILLS